MKILTDFDGTLTDIQHEYEFELQYIRHALEERCAIPSQEFDAMYQAVCAYIAREPSQYGWYHNGRISVFSDEDLFMRVAAAMTQLDAWKSDPPKTLVSIMEKMGDLSFMAVTEEAHDAMNLEPLSHHNTPEPQVIEAFQSLLDQDCEIVVASNSPASRIIPKFEYMGLKPVDHENNPSAHFRVRGRSGKYILGNAPTSVDFGSRTIDVNHPEFRKIISEERPQVVIGDVFSLDLALPAVMAKQEPLIYEDMQLYLRTRSYTPDWAIECIQSPLADCPASFRFLNSFSDLPSMVRKRF